MTQVVGYVIPLACGSIIGTSFAVLWISFTNQAEARLLEIDKALLVDLRLRVGLLVAATTVSYAILRFATPLELSDAFLAVSAGLSGLAGIQFHSNAPGVPEPRQATLDA